MAVQRLRIVDEAPADGQAPLDVVIDGLENGGQSITSVEVSTLFANQPATAELEGTVLKLGIPKGETGPAGAAWSGLSNVSQGAGGYNASATVANPGEDFYLPKGDRLALGIGRARIGAVTPYRTVEP